MSTNMSGEPRPRNLCTAGLVAYAQKPQIEDDNGTDGEADNVSDNVVDNSARRPDEQQTALAPLFTKDAAGDFRSRWDIVQRGFVDDPKQAVRAGDELVAQVIKSLAETFSSQRAAIEAEQTDQASTENLRQALRRYRSFFERLLSI